MRKPIDLSQAVHLTSEDDFFKLYDEWAKRRDIYTAVTGFNIQTDNEVCVAYYPSSDGKVYYLLVEERS